MPGRRGSPGSNGNPFRFASLCLAATVAVGAIASLPGGHDKKSSLQHPASPLPSGPASTLHPSPGPHSSPSGTPIPDESTCAAFKDFYGFAGHTPPNGHWGEYVSRVEVFGAVALNNAEHSKDSRAELDQAENLVAYVGATSFPETGNIDGHPFSVMIDRCFS